MKCTWMITESDDKTADFVQVYITFEDGGSESLVIAGLPSETFARDRRIVEAVHKFVSDWEDKQIFNQLTADFDKMISMTERASKSPPVIAEMLLSFLAPKSTAQAFLGDLQEMFEQNVERFGEKPARQKYWMEVIGSLVPLIWQWLKRIGFVAFLLDYFRSKFGF